MEQCSDTRPMKKYLIVFSAFLCLNLPLSADEGMWMTNNLDKKKSALCGAIVSYDFMGTGSLVSDQGLVVTNHHVVYSDVFELGAAMGKNLLADGFWAYERSQEIPIPGRSVQILLQTIDVTDEVEALIASGEVKKSSMMNRRLGGILEKKYEEQTGKIAILSSMWRGSRYFISIYENYTDIRLVAAPPESIGAFGGDVDNWEWPQQKGDFSFVRIYTAPDGSPADYSAENVPLKSPQHLKIAKKSVKEGDKTMVIGYPGRTNRYNGSAQVAYQIGVSLPVSVEVRGAQMEILRKWMNADPAVRAKYSDHFFGLSNAQELYSGQVECCKRFGVVQEKLEQEKELNQWINASQERREKWGSLTGDLAKAYSDIADTERQAAYFRECLSRATKLSPLATRTFTTYRNSRAGSERFNNLIRSMQKDYESMDLRVEKEIFGTVLQLYFSNVSDAMLGDYQKQLKAEFGSDYASMRDFLWNGSWMTSMEKIDAMLAGGFDWEAAQQDICQDRMVRFFNDNKIVRFNDEVERLLEGKSTSELTSEYTHALYQMRLEKGMRQYPDANSTLRISYGSVKAYSPRDAVNCNWHSTVKGLLEKHDPNDHDFCLPDAWKAALETRDPGMTVNFITDNDITGGNSGSPVLNAKGEIVGLAFDGNKESLASDVSFTPDYNRCICVDFRFVLWTLRDYAHFDSLLEELQQ